MAHPEAKWPSQKNARVFVFCITLFFNSISGHNFDRTVARVTNLADFNPV